jgi:DNA phosphorothioation-dependent restriction protein DptG
MREQREYWAKYIEINKHKNELFKEMMQYFTGISSLDKDSEEKELRYAKIDEIHKLMDEEKEKIEPEIKALADRYSKWYVDTSDIDDLINLGDYISAYYTELNADRDGARECSDMIGKLLNEDNTLYDRYVKWQGTDEYIKEFEKEKMHEITREI